MTAEGYGAFDDPYAYPGTTVLRNKLDLRDQETLDAFEVEITTLRTEEPLPETTAFGTKSFRIPFDATGKKWVRFAVWDAAGDGAWLQPVLVK